MTTTETRVQRLEKGVHAAIRLAGRLPHQASCPAGLGHSCTCEHQALVTFLADLRRDSVPVIDADLGTVPGGDEAVAVVQAGIHLARLHERAIDAELRVTALERELALAQEASRTLAHAYLTDGRPPSHLLAYASSLPVQLPHVREPEDYSTAISSLEALVDEERAEVARLKGRVAELEASLAPADATAGDGR